MLDWRVQFAVPFADMLKQAVIDYFGSATKTAAAIGVTKSAVHQWRDIIPRGAAYIAQAVSKGKLKVDPSLYPPKRYKPAA